MKNKNCVWCNQEFELKKGNQKYHSLDCRLKASNDRIKKKNAEKRNQIFVILICPECGISFKRTANIRFCTPEHRTNYYLNKKQIAEKSIDKITIKEKITSVGNSLLYGDVILRNMNNDDLIADWKESYLVGKGGYSVKAIKKAADEMRCEYARQ